MTQSLMTWQGYLEPVLEATRHDSSKPGHDKGNTIELPWQSTAEGTSGPPNLRILKSFIKWSCFTSGLIL